MSEVSSLNDVLKTAAISKDVEKEEVITTTAKPEVGENQELIETEDGYRIVEKRDISSSEDAQELHSSTPEESLDNLAKLAKEMDAKVERAREIKEEHERTKEIETALDEVDKKYNDEIIEVPEEKMKEIESQEEDPEYRKRMEEEAKALSEIKILKFKKSDQKRKQYDRILEKRRKTRNEEAFQSVLINSGYSARYTGFLSPETLAIRNVQQNSDVYEATKFMYEKMYEHQVSTSIGKMTFEQWMKGTSLLELNSIFFALFCSTYPEVNEYPGQCVDKKCNDKFNGKPFTFSYENKKLMYIPDEYRDEVSKQIVNILHTEDPIGLFKDSEVHFTLRKKLSNGTILDFRHPSLYNHLKDTLEKLNDLGLLSGEEDPDSEALFNLLPYIDKIYVLDDELGGYIQLESCEEKLKELQFMDDDDLTTCGEIVSKIQEEYKIRFGFRGLVCPRCGKKLPDQPIGNVSELLFLVQMWKTSKKDI